MFSKTRVRAFAEEWFNQLSDHVAVDDIIKKVSDQSLDMRFPERTLRSHEDFRDWYKNVGDSFDSQSHVIEKFDIEPAGDGVRVKVQVVWAANQTTDNTHLRMRATQSWMLGKSPSGDPIIVKYAVETLNEVPEGVSDLNPQKTIDLYYKYANTGNWDSWLDLFDEDLIMDEQLGGHVEKLSTLREMMKGFGGYSKFQNKPQHVIISEDQAAVLSHISARTTSGVDIEATVMNYFQFSDEGKITYMANVHDTVPFKAFSEGQA